MNKVDLSQKTKIENLFDGAIQNQLQSRPFMSRLIKKHHILTSVLIRVTALAIAFDSLGLSVCTVQGFRKDMNAILYLIV